jgi:hypothetical protein
MMRAVVEVVGCGYRRRGAIVIAAITSMLFSGGSLLMSSRAIAQTPAPIYRSSTYTVWPDRVEEGAYSAHAVSGTEIVSTYPVGGHGAGAEARWKLDEDISSYPQLRSDDPLIDALYNLSLSDLKKDQRPDGAFNAGKTWGGVWTRDVSYSTVLSLAAIAPEGAKASLLQKVKRDRIVQDTGTGGSWPVSIDRMTWSLAAWEIYLSTGDRDWLKKSYGIIRNSILDDEAVVMDRKTGLARGESSFLDWREQTYPGWMQPADIGSSENLGTNAVFYRSYRILASMAQQLGEPDPGWTAKADRMRESINRLFWVADRGYFGQYRYGRAWKTLSPRSEALGQALLILFDVPDGPRQDQVLRSQPLMAYGIPTVYPVSRDIPPYHNRATWPFVQAFWNLAAAKRGDEAQVLYGLASIYRESALFLTNKENFVSQTGSPVGTAINSDRQLWSVAGNLAMVYRVLFGMHFEIDGLHLSPCIPESLKGERELSNFHYRAATLRIVVKGFGSHVRRASLDGHAGLPFVPSGLTGDHVMVLEMDGRPAAQAKMKLVEEQYAPATPVVTMEDGTLRWEAVDGASEYRIYVGGVRGAVVSATSYKLPDGGRAEQYQVAAKDALGHESFLSEPLKPGADAIQFSAVSGGAGAESYVDLTTLGTTGLSVSGEVPKAGRYSLSVRYANGSGDVKFENKCAVRTLFVDGREAGSIVMPQRGQNDWSNWGESTDQTIDLSAGEHRFELRFMPQDINMNGEVNHARVASITLMPLQ